MIQAVLDLNVIASAAVSVNGTPRILVDAWRDGLFALVISRPMTDRLAQTLGKPYFRERLSDVDRAIVLDRLRKQGRFVMPADDVRGVADDLEDDLVLATAVAGNATHLVTGDRRLLECNGYRGLILLTPAAFRLVLEQPEMAEPR